jgi:hypothetical protein
MLCHVVVDNSPRTGVTIPHSIQTEKKFKKTTGYTVLFFLAGRDGDRSQTQREGMGLLEYQALPFLLDV